MSDGCELKVGRLIAHVCGRKAVHHCGRCGKNVCRHHFDTTASQCVHCTGALKQNLAQISLEDIGDPLDFAPEVYAAFDRRAGAPEDELSGIDS